MKKPLALALVLGCSLCLMLLVSCSDASYITPAMTFAYDDFGSEPIASSLLGPKGKDTQVIVRFASTRITPPADGPDIRFVNTEKAMWFLRREVRKMPKTEETAAERQRLQSTYSRLYEVYSTKRNSFLSTPGSTYGPGVDKALMMPPMPPRI